MAQGQQVLFIPQLSKLWKFNHPQPDISTHGNDLPIDRYAASRNLTI